MFTTELCYCYIRNLSTESNPFSADGVGAEDTPAFTRGALGVWVLYLLSLTTEAGADSPPGSVGLPYLLHMHLPAQ